MDRPKIHLKGDRDAPTSGLFGQISFDRLVDVLRAGGHFGTQERVTDLIVDAKRGFISYRIEQK